MGGFEVIAPLAISLFSTAAGVASTQQQAKRQKRATLLQLDRDRRERVRQLREATATNRARAAGSGVSAGGSAVAIERGLQERSAQLGQDARQDASLQLQQIQAQRNSSLLNIAERQARQALGLYGDLFPSAPPSGGQNRNPVS